MNIYPISPIAGLTLTDGNFIVGDGTDWVAESGATARTSLGLAIGTNVQAQGAVLDDLNALGVAASNGQFIVATGAGAFAYESGATARTSLGLGTIATFDGDQNLQEADDVVFNKVTAGGFAAPTLPKGHLLLAASGDYVTVPDNATLDILYKLTISFWLYRDADSASEDQICHGTTDGQRSFYVFTTTNGRILFWITPDGTSANREYCISDTSVIGTGGWQHIILTYDGIGDGGNGLMKLYVDNVEKTFQANKSGTLPSSIHASTEDFFIGHGLNNDFIGKIDNVAIFNAAVDINIRAVLYNSGSRTAHADFLTQGDLVSAWLFDDGTVNDNKGSNDGTLQGAASVVEEEVIEFDASIEITGSLDVAGKLDAGTVDPLSVEYQYANRQKVIDDYAKYAYAGKKSVVTYINENTDELELYYTHLGVIKNIKYEVIYTLPKVLQNPKHRIRYHLDPVTGELVAKKKPIYEKYRIKKDCYLDKDTGRFFKRTEIGTETIEKKEAVEITKELK